MGSSSSSLNNSSSSSLNSSSSSKLHQDRHRELTRLLWLDKRPPCRTASISSLASTFQTSVSDSVKVFIYLVVSTRFLVAVLTKEPSR